MWEMGMCSCMWSPEEGWSWCHSVCELPEGGDGDWMNSGPLYKQDELLNTKPSLRLSLPRHLNYGVLFD